MINFRNRLPLAQAIFLMMLSLPALAMMGDLSLGLSNYIRDRWGNAGLRQVQGWYQLLHKEALPSPPDKSLEPARLDTSNSFWNRVPYFSDKEHWGVEDYWATPIEMLASNGGDCEDYSIGKYFSLKELGIPVQKLRIVYVRALNRGESHMVLAYYPEPDADPLILDNLNTAILPASKRPDLYPVFSFNDDDLWDAGSQARTGKSNQIRLWRDLLEKMAKEQKL